MSKCNIIGLLMIIAVFFAAYFIPLILWCGIVKTLIGTLVIIAVISWIVLGCFLLTKKAHKDEV